MKNRILVCCTIWLCSNAAFSQKKTDSVILLKKILSDGSYRVVFIDANKHSPYKEEIRTLHIDSSEYSRQLQELKDSLGLTITKHPVAAIPKVWYSLYLYRNKYYVYKPSDRGTSPWLKITDSTVIELYFDPGIVTSVLTGAKKTRSIVQLGFSNMIDRGVNMTIHYIDPVRGIAIIERHYGPPEIRYTLMISEDKLNLYPVIVNYNRDGRVEEWEFDKPDYKRLLQGKTGK